METLAEDVNLTKGGGGGLKWIFCVDSNLPQSHCLYLSFSHYP